MNKAIRPIMLVTVVIGLAIAPIAYPQTTPAGPLPSWNDGKPKRVIIDFVSRVTTQGSPDFVAPAARVATIDNDGTLWCEQPAYFQALFVFDRVKELAAKNPLLKEKPPFRAILENDRVAMASFNKHDLSALLAVTHSGMTSEEFDRIARGWLDLARHPRFGHLFKECVYQPQLELLAYLGANNFKLFIVSGGGTDFIRAYAEGTYGIPPERVIGSSIKTKFRLENGKAELIKLPELESLDDGPVKPVNINLHIGRRPIFAFGNSDGDLEMLQYTIGGPGLRLALLLHHDDAEREYAYDRHSQFGRLDRAWDEAMKQGWPVVSMKRDFKRVFAFEK